MIRMFGSEYNHFYKAKGDDDFGQFRSDYGHGEDDNLAKCHIGNSLSSRVHTLIGIAGANFGMCACANEMIAQSSAACGKKVEN